MNKYLSCLLCCTLFLYPTIARGDIFSFGFSTPGTITNTVQNINIDTSGASGRARAFYVTGNWEAAGGDPWTYN